MSILTEVILITPEVMKRLKADVLTSMAMRFGMFIPSAIAVNREINSNHSQSNIMQIVRDFPDSAPEALQSLFTRDMLENTDYGGIKGMSIIKSIAKEDVQYVQTALYILSNYRRTEAASAILDIVSRHREFIPEGKQALVRLMGNAHNDLSAQIANTITKYIRGETNFGQRHDIEYEYAMADILAAALDESATSDYPPELTKSIADARQNLLRSIFRNSTGLNEFHNPEDMERVEMLKTVFAEVAPQLHKVATGMLDYQEAIRKAAPALQAA